jgi:uncharacterized membrane protein
VLGLDAPLRASGPDEVERVAPAVLTPPDVPHAIGAKGDVAILYVEPESRIGASLTAARPDRRLQAWFTSLRIALAAMFLLTASAHFGSLRSDLVRMVPPIFPRPDLIVTLTGIAEILGAIGLLVPRTAPWAAGCLSALLLAMFPANVHSALEGIPLGGRPATPLVLRTVLQLVFLAATLVAAAPHRSMAAFRALRGQRERHAG